VLRRKGFGNNTLFLLNDFLEPYAGIYARETALLSIHELYNIYWAVKRVAPLPGDLAEVGVYKGGSAKMICEVKGEKKLHLFDTFQGMPETDASIDVHKKGDFSDTSLESVRSYLAGCRNVEFHKGVFPETASNLPPETRFCFVNLDVDLYRSTLDGLRFFYPRMSRGGIIISHDYRSISCPGVKKAFDEFLSDKPETLIELWDTQCLVVKA
jgi:hypothetical protein